MLKNKTYSSNPAVAMAAKMLPEQSVFKSS